MSFPLSKPVSPGETTLASQYNDLRTDALYLGGDAAQSASVRQLLSAIQSEIRLNASGSVITLSASESDPCAFLFAEGSGVVQTPQRLTLNAQEFPASGLYWLFAKKTVGEIGFTLIARSTEEETPDTHCIGSFLWDAVAENVSGLRSLEVERIVKTLPPPLCCKGRLTVVSGNPFPTSDVQTATTLYFTPCYGNYVSLYQPDRGWGQFPFDQLSVSLAGLSADRCYDALIHLNSEGKPQLTLEPWGSLTSRAQPLNWLQGIPVLAADPSRRYLGTIGLNVNGSTRDTVQARLIWNLYNQVYRPLRKLCGVSQGSNLSSGVWLPYAQDDGLFVTCVIGQNYAELLLNGCGAISTMNANASALGIGIDIDLSDYSLNSNAADLSALEYKAGALTTFLSNRLPNRLLGKHTYHLVSYTLNDTHTFNGTNLPQNMVGLAGTVLG